MESTTEIRSRFDPNLVANALVQGGYDVESKESDQLTAIGIFLKANTIAHEYYGLVMGWQWLDAVRYAAERVAIHLAIKALSQARIYDNPKFVDRYTVVFMDRATLRHNIFECFGMSKQPFHPQGIGQHSSARPGRHLGRRIGFNELPYDCRLAAIQA